MKKLLLLIVPLLMMSCSKSEEESEYITLDRQSITLDYGDEKIVLVETNLENFIAESQDEYVAGAYASGLKSIDVCAYKVGKTKVVVYGGSAQAELEVEVKTTNDKVGTPVVALGQDIAYIKKNEDAKFKGESSDRLFYSDSDVPFGANHSYRFKNGKLYCILTEIGISKLNSSFKTYNTQLSESLKQRYEGDDSYMGEYQTIFFFHYKREYYIGIRKGSGNGSWYICYAKTRQEVIDVLDINPSIAP